MKITFEGTFGEILKEMETLLAAEVGTLSAPRSATQKAPHPGPTVPAPKPQPDFIFEGPGLGGSKGVPHVDKSVANPVGKSGRTDKQLANDERLRERALAKKAAGLKPFDKMPKVAAPTPQPVEPEKPVDPAEVVSIRNKTITDLQEAYANGHQQEVFELLSRFGNGAKSFRELPPEAFLPISQAIAKGALT